MLPIDTNVSYAAVVAVVVFKC